MNIKSRGDRAGEWEVSNHMAGPGFSYKIVPCSTLSKVNDLFVHLVIYHPEVKLDPKKSSIYIIDPVVMKH